MKKRNIFALLLAFLIMSGFVLRIRLVNAAASGNYSGGFLTKSPAAKPASMGEAYTAFGSDVGGIEAYHYNPAAPAFNESMRMSFMGHRGIADDTYGSLFFGMPTPIGGVSGNLIYYSLGDIDLYNNLGQKSTVKAENDFSASLNYSDKFMLDFLSSGLTLKYVRSTLVDSVSANAWAADLGLLGRFMEDKLSFGISYLNLGSQLSYVDISEPLPATFRAGAAYKFFSDERSRFTGAFDFVRVKDEDWRQYVGAEYLWADWVAFRAGYKNGVDKGRLNFGVGFLWNRYNIDYAFTDAGALGSLHTFSVGMRFGRGSKEDRAFNRKMREQRQRESGGSGPVQVRNAASGQKPFALFEVQPTSNNEDNARAVSEALKRRFESSRKSFIMVPENNLESAKAAGAGKAVIATLSSLGNFQVVKVKCVDLRTTEILYTESAEAGSLEEIKRKAEKILDRLLSVSK